MELLAAIEGLRSIKPQYYPTEIYLYTDSQYVVKGLTEWLTSWKKRGWKSATKSPIKNKELWMELDSIHSNFSNIRVVWVKGHSNSFGNNKADSLANYAMDMNS
jgi:ribonuclease HI